MYVLILTAQAGTSNVVLGLEAGADDYIIKSFEFAEVRARLRVGQRIVELQDTLAKRLHELEEQIAHVKLLRGLLPICSCCKRVRVDPIIGSNWRRISALTPKPCSATESVPSVTRNTGPRTSDQNSESRMAPFPESCPAPETVAGGTPLRILVAEDDPLYSRVLTSWLTKWGFDIELAQDGAQAWDLLQRPDAPKLALLDWMMPSVNGVELCHRVRARENESYVYLVLLTARDSKDDLLAGLRAGADDYMLKPFDPDELQARLRSGQRIIELQDELLRTQALLREQAAHDSLTGVLNRNAVLSMLQGEIERHKRETADLAVLMCDLDHFKAINDGFGHMVGDEVLRQIAGRMSGVLRTYDTLGRYGGEEFLVVLPHCGAEQLARVAERLRTCVSERPLIASAGAIPLTISIGGVARTIQPGKQDEAGKDELAQLLFAADAALYRAKDAGRNCVVLA